MRVTILDNAIKITMSNTVVEKMYITSVKILDKIDKSRRK